MDFVIDSYEDGDENNPDDSFKPSTFSEGNSMGFDFITDEDDEINILEKKQSEADDTCEIYNIDLSTSPKKLESNVHTLAHLFDEVELPEKKTVSKKSFIGFDSSAKDKPVGNEKNKNSSGKTQQLPLSKKLLDGLTNKVKKQILPLSIKDEVDKLLEKSEILKNSWDEFMPSPRLSKRKAEKLKQKEKEKTKGDKWFGLPATELTQEAKMDLEVMQMRSVLDPKHFYKKNHMKVLPKYFQIGKVQDSPLDYYSSRLTKKEKKKTLVDELMADVEFKKYNKNKYAEILKEKEKTHYKAWRQAKRQKNKNK